MLSLAFLRNFAHKSPNLRFLTVRLLATENTTTNSIPNKPSSAYYDELIFAAGLDRDFDKIRYLLNKRITEHCLNTTETFKFITNTERSRSILDDLIQTLSRLNNGFTRRTAFESLIARLSRLDRVEDSLRIVDLMARENYGISAFTFHPILNSLSRKKRMAEAWRVLELMTALGVTPDLTAYNYLLTAYCHLGKSGAASGVLKRIEEEGLGADERTYDALVLGACRAGKEEGAMVIVRRMMDDEVEPLHCTYTHVINGLVKRGYFGQAIKFVMICGGRDVKLDVENFGVLCRRLINLKRNEEAYEVLEEMEKRGLAMCGKLRDYYVFNNNFSASIMI